MKLPTGRVQSPQAGWSITPGNPPFSKFFGSSGRGGPTQRKEKLCSGTFFSPAPAASDASEGVVFPPAVCHGFPCPPPVADPIGRAVRNWQPTDFGRPRLELTAWDGWDFFGGNVPLVSGQTCSAGVGEGGGERAAAHRRDANQQWTEKQGHAARGSGIG